MDARKGVGDYANVSGLLSNVHHSVTAVGTATTMIAIPYLLYDNPYLHSSYCDQCIQDSDSGHL